MNPSTEQRLTFAAVDDLAFAAERGRLGRLPPTFKVKPQDLGPLLEYLHLSAAGRLPALVPTPPPWFQLDGAGPLCHELASGSSLWIAGGQRQLGFLRLAADDPSGQRQWSDLGILAHMAAKGAGFPSSIAAELLGAMGEMRSNVFEHSGAPATGLVAYRARQGSFEFVIADRGIGILNSLRTSDAYRDLVDHGKALRLAITDNVSRFGNVLGRGKGFRQLFIGLAQLRGDLRFRSGDSSLTMRGIGPAPVSAGVDQKPGLPGFFISVVCRIRDKRGREGHDGAGDASVDDDSALKP